MPVGYIQWQIVLFIVSMFSRFVIENYDSSNPFTFPDAMTVTRTYTFCLRVQAHVNEFVDVSLYLMYIARTAPSLHPGNINLWQAK